MQGYLFPLRLLCFRIGKKAKRTFYISMLMAHKVFPKMAY